MKIPTQIYIKPKKKSSISSQNQIVFFFFFVQNNVAKHLVDGDSSSEKNIEKKTEEREGEI